MDMNIAITEISLPRVTAGNSSGRSVNGSNFNETFAKEMSGQSADDQAASLESTPQHDAPSPAQEAAANADTTETAPSEQAASGPETAQATQGAKAQKQQAVPARSDALNVDPELEPATSAAGKGQMVATTQGHTELKTVDIEEVTEAHAGSASPRELHTPEHRKDNAQSVADTVSAANQPQDSAATTATTSLHPDIPEQGAATAQRPGTVVQTPGTMQAQTAPAHTTGTPATSSLDTFSGMRPQAGNEQHLSASHANVASSGKILQDSGKNLPVNSKTDKPESMFRTLLAADNGEVENAAGDLLQAIGLKSAKPEGQSANFNSGIVESFSILNTGAGKTLTPHPSFRSELASQQTSYTSLTSDFLAGSEEWCQDFGAKIEWMSNEHVSKAELSLHPAELGVLDITINTEDDRISINIVTHNEKSREMLESSMPRLNELLKNQGLALGDSNISHNSASDRHNAHAEQSASFLNSAPEDQHTAEPGNRRSALVRHQGQIDHYV